jgi:proline iminopeptidase
MTENSVDGPESTRPVRITRALGRYLLALLSFPVATVVGIAGWVIALVALSFATTHVQALFALSLAAAFLLAAVLPWLMMALTDTFGRGAPFLAAIGGVATVALLQAVAMPAVLSPLVPRSALRQQARPSPKVRYWQLPTGSRIAYYRQAAVGQPRPTPVIHLHGGPGIGYGEDLEIEYPEIAALGFEQYWYDQVGAGFSERLRDITEYTIQRHVADLEAIRQEIGAERIILIGTSWGGTLAANYMAAHPDRVARAILDSPGEIDPSEWTGETTPREEADGEPEEAESDDGTTGRRGDGATGRRGDGPGDSDTERGARSAAQERSDGAWWENVPIPVERRTLVDRLETNPRYLVSLGIAQWNPKLAHNLFPDPEADAYWARILEATDGEEYASCGLCGFWSHAMTNGDALTPGRGTRAALKGNRTPTLILRGEEDFIPREIAYQYKETLPNATFLSIPGAGHDVGGAAPETFFEIVTAFLIGKPLRPS